MLQRMAVCSAVAGVLLGITNSVLAAVPMTSIADSYHNLGATNSRVTSPNSVRSTTEDEICVFCHTPHG